MARCVLPAFWEEQPELLTAPHSVKSTSRRDVRARKGPVSCLESKTLHFDRWAHMFCFCAVGSVVFSLCVYWL